VLKRRCRKINNRAPKQIGPTNFDELSRKTGLVIRSVDSDTIDSLFYELERYDSRERAETFEYLKLALNKTRSSLGAEAAYTED
jgi:hypothetical protein